MILNSNKSVSFTNIRDSAFHTQFFLCGLSELGYNESCLNDKECSDTIGLKCVDEKCVCDSTRFWNGTHCCNFKFKSQKVPQEFTIDFHSSKVNTVKIGSCPSHLSYLDCYNCSIGNCK
jgi:hypothetical protein